MNKMSREEFNDRIEALQRSRKIFIESGLTDNITVAFEAYQTVCADRERKLFLSSQSDGNRKPSMMDQYERPKCPDCGSDMMFRVMKENEEGVKTQLVCSGLRCDTVLNDEHDLSWWMENLRKKDA